MPCFRDSDVISPVKAACPLEEPLSLAINM